MIEMKKSSVSAFLAVLALLSVFETVCGDWTDYMRKSYLPYAVPLGILATGPAAVKGTNSPLIAGLYATTLLTAPYVTTAIQAWQRNSGQDSNARSNQLYYAGSAITPALATGLGFVLLHPEFFLNTYPGVATLLISMKGLLGSSYALFPPLVAIIAELIHAHYYKNAPAEQSASKGAEQQ